MITLLPAKLMTMFALKKFYLDALCLFGRCLLFPCIRMDCWRLAPSLFHLPSECCALLPFTVRCLTLIKSCWGTWTWQVAVECYRLMMQRISGETASSCPPSHPSFLISVSFHIISPFWSHLTLISHGQWMLFLFCSRSPVMWRSQRF